MNFNDGGYSRQNTEVKNQKSELKINIANYKPSHPRW